MGDLGDKLRNAGDWLAKHIPGFAGYVKREERRRADKIFRDFLVEKLKDAKSILNRATVDITDLGDMDALKKLSRIESKYETVTDRLRLADYGYTGWFDTTQISFDELNKIYEFDIGLTTHVEEILATTKDLKSAQPDKILKILANLNLALDDLNEKLRERDNMFINKIKFKSEE